MLCLSHNLSIYPVLITIHNHWITDKRDKHITDKDLFNRKCYLNASNKYNVMRPDCTEEKLSQHKIIDSVSHDSIVANSP